MKLVNQSIIELVNPIFKDTIQIPQAQQVNLENSANILKFKIIKLSRLMIANQFIVFSKNLFIEILKVNQFILQKMLVKAKLKFALNHVIIVKRKKRKLNKMIKINFEFRIKSFSTFNRCFFFFRFWSNT